MTAKSPSEEITDDKPLTPSTALPARLDVAEDMINKIKKNKNIFFNSGKTKIRRIENKADQ